ncbi:MAG: flagellar hook-length control protein FliK, partial [Gammaproteobacteria bacterium]|nr:flagellar hook-length control protein FliK [Gammaproteobacteria bacterium]
PTLTRILAGVLPWQYRLDQGLNQLQQALPALAPPPTTLNAASAGTPSASAAPEALGIRQAQTLLNTFLQRLPDSTTLSQWARQADGGSTAIRQWLQNSGLFAEANLLRADTTATQADLKLVLNRMLQPLLGLVSQGNDPLNALQRFKPMTSPELLLNPLQFPQPALLGHLPTAAPREELQVGDLLRLLAGMLNRITAQQLQSQLATPQTPNDPAPAQQWLLDLPWVDPRGETRVMQMRVERDDTEERDANGKRRVRQWRLQLALQLDGLGPVLFDLTLQAGALSTRIWAENAQALPRIQAALPELETHLHRLGLEVTRLECRQGHPSTPRTRLEHRLLDIRA